MVPKSGTRLPNSRIFITDAEFGRLIGTALQDELGASRRASKTIIAWTGVSDHTARAWLNGRTSPSGLHLIELAAHSRFVMAMILRLTGQGNVAIGMNLRDIEESLVEALNAVRILRSKDA